MKLVENSVPNNINGECAQCVVCHREEDGRNKLTWQLIRQDTTLENEQNVKDWIERRQGQPSVLVLPDDGGIGAYSVAPYCEGCLDGFLREYEERHTTSGEMTRDELQRKISTSCDDNGWKAYALQLQYLAPRGFPNFVLTKNERLLFRSVRGDVNTRLRAFHPPAHTLITSPEVPQEIRELLQPEPSERRSSDTVAFLYMDEKYIDSEAPPEIQVTSLTGLLVASDSYPRFREGFLKIVPGFDEGPKNLGVEIHAANLFPGRSVDDHFEFYRGLVSLINELECKVYRRGFNFIPGHSLLRKNQKKLIGLCFRTMLISVDDFEDYAQIWPVMETDQSKEQDEYFAGYVRWMDQATAHLQMVGDGVDELIDDDYMVDNSRFGDLHYVTKKSIAGIAVDCLVYLLHCKWLAENGFRITDYKAQLAAIATALRPHIIDDYIGSFRV